MSTKKPRKQKSGGAKLKAAGRKAILLGVSPAVYDKLKELARIEMRPLSQCVTFHAMKAATRILDDI